MAGLLDYGGPSAGLLGNIGQALRSYSSRTGVGASPLTREELEEYERDKEQGFVGSFDDWRLQKEMREQNAVRSAAQTQYQNAMPIKVFRPGIENPPHGFLRGGY